VSLELDQQMADRLTAHHDAVQRLGSATITMTSGTIACVVHYNQAGHAKALSTCS